MVGFCSLVTFWNWSKVRTAESARAASKSADMLLSDLSVRMLQTMTRRFLARVMATFNRRNSCRNPTADRLLARTQDRITVSASEPWNESTDVAGNRMASLRRFTWPL